MPQAKEPQIFVLRIIFELYIYMYLCEGGNLIVRIAAAAAALQS